MLLNDNPHGTIYHTQKCIEYPLNEDKAHSSHHDQAQPINLAAIHNEIECNNAYWDAFVSFLLPRDVESSSNTTVTSIQQLTMMMTAMVPPMQQSSLDNNATALNIVTMYHIG